MAGKVHPVWDAAKVSAFLFATLIFFIAFLSLYINAVIEDERQVAPETTAQNIQAHGRLHPRLPQ